MASYKPSDFYIGVVDLFSILLPGGLMVALLQLPTLQTELGELFHVWDGDPAGSESAARGWIAFFVAAYIVGHVLKHVSTDLLNRPVYEGLYLGRWRKPKSAPTEGQAEGEPSKPGGNARGDELADLEQLVRDKMTDDGWKSPYEWARAHVRVADVPGASDVERLEADQKFFRSLSLVLIVAVGLGVRQGTNPIVLLTGLALVALTLVRFCRLRFKEAYAMYSYYLVLANKTAGAGPGAAPE